MGQLNIKDEALIAEAKALAELLGTSTTDAVRQAVHDRLERERAGRDAERQRRYEAIMAAARDLRGALGGKVMSNAELDEMLYDPEDGIPPVIVDTSAIIALVRQEPDAPLFGRALSGAVRPRISATNWFEAAMAAEGRDPANGALRFDRVMAASGIEVVPVTLAMARRAREAWRRFGKGRHPAALNFGDCFAYALATELDEPLLFKGDDFSKTDVKAAI